MRFNHRRYTRWTNTGDATVGLGDPITRDTDEDNGLGDGDGAQVVPRFDVLAMKSPVDQSPEADAYVNVGGDVGPGEDGIWTEVIGPTLLHVDDV